MLNFQDMIATLTNFWAKKGCAIHQGYDLEVGAGTFNPVTFLRCLGPEPYSAAYVEPSRRPQDGRYGLNPNRVQFYHQMQIILKPSPPNIQDLYLESLEAVGLNIKEHDIRFVHDDWENPTIGAWGLGWEIWVDGMEVTQFTYFQAVGGISVKPVSGELTVGLERLAMYLQGVDSMFDLKWNDDLLYGDIYKRSEWEWSHYNFKHSDPAMWFRHFDDFEAEAKRLTRDHYPIPAYDFVMKASHAFNMLDARGVISVTERTNYMSRIRTLAKNLAESYIKSREKQDYPLLRTSDAPEKISLPPMSEAFDPSEKQDFLLEIGSEELPATFVPIGMANLKKAITTLVDKHSLSYSNIQAYGTPRRLSVVVSNLAAGSSSQSTEKKGPAITTAFDSTGTLTKAGAGFFRSINRAPTTLPNIKEKKIPQLSIRTIKGTDYLFATVETKGLSTRALLARSLEKLILTLDFPKKMRWGNLDIEYARPLRWIVALFGKEEIPFHVHTLLASRSSSGHRLLSHKSFEIATASEYVEQLKKHHVMVDPEERKCSINDQISSIEKTLQGSVSAVERVMPQVLHLVEWPFVTSASFDPMFLKAPKQVLISEMVEHQKYFPLVNASNELMPHFMIVCNNMASDLIRLGNQRALSPRLADGMFLYEEDLKTPLDTFALKLKSVTFQKELGSVSEKVNRITGNVEIVHSFLKIGDLAKAKRAAALCKADLVSELVGEFPELQGEMGELYALNSGEDKQVATAISEHWMPRGEKAPLPKTPCGLLVSIADKIDNLLCCFALGLKPTSSSDPHALRRQVIGMIKMMLQEKLHLPLPKVFSECFELMVQNPALNPKTKQQFIANKDQILSDIIDFISNRFKTVLQEHNFDKDIIDAVLFFKLTNIYDAYDLIAQTQEMRNNSHQQFCEILEMTTRCRKILFSQNPNLIAARCAHTPGTVVTDENRYPAVDPSLFQDPAESALFNKAEEIKDQFHLSLLDRRDTTTHNFKQAFVLLHELYPLVTTLFDTTKVVADDPQIRQNRLSLLQEVWDCSTELLAFSQIQEHASESR